MQLTSDNYYSPEANAEYMSNSTFGRWIECAARQRAIETGEFVPEIDPVALIGGRYGHMLVLEPHRQAEYDEENPEVRKAQTAAEQKSAAEWKAIAKELELPVKGNASRQTIVDAVIEAGREDLVPPTKYSFTSDFAWIPRAMEAYERQTLLKQAIDRGKHEVILTFELGGIMWKCMIDNLREGDEQFDDLKFMRDFKEIWHKQRRQYLPWFEKWNYARQMAIYQHAIRDNYKKTFTPNIFGFSKEKISDPCWIQFVDQSDLRRRLRAVEDFVPTILAYRSGDLPAPRCGKSDCDYCASTKVITRPQRPTFGVRV